MIEHRESILLLILKREKKEKKKSERKTDGHDDCQGNCQGRTAKHTRQNGHKPQLTIVNNGHVM